MIDGVINLNHASMQGAIRLAGSQLRALWIKYLHLVGPIQAHDAVILEGIRGLAPISPGIVVTRSPSNSTEGFVHSGGT
jgi:hypothetical protein